MRTLINENLIYSVYFAPNGREKLLHLGEQLGQRHLSYKDRLIGIVGDAGSGKSLIIKGMFPGLELVNNDSGVNAGSVLQMRSTLDRSFDFTTYHFDMRFQTAFVQMFEIVDFVKEALAQDRRVIVEHFDLLYPHLKINAELLIGVGAEIVVTRPNLFGPVPKDIYDMVFTSLRTRKMAHSAEDLTAYVIGKEFGIERKNHFGNVRGGFTMNYEKPLDIDFFELEDRVQSLINIGLPISYVDDDNIRIGEEIISCTSPRLHVRNTNEIINYQLLKEMRYDELNDRHLLIGTVGNRKIDFRDLNKIKKESEA